MSADVTGDVASPQHYYKIVQTTENGKVNLAAVPYLWEKDGKLMWPPKPKQTFKNLQSMTPSGIVNEGWSELNCVVKRTYIPTYEAAEEEMKVMFDLSHTETESTFAFAVPAKPAAK